jgi:protein-L-isoaspartate(D-aspartate) O-methyltransferase
MNLEQARHNMVEQQIRTWEVLDQDVLDLLYAVPREDFVPSAYRNIAFSDWKSRSAKASGCGRRNSRRACSRSSQFSAASACSKSAPAAATSLLARAPRGAGLHGRDPACARRVRAREPRAARQGQCHCRGRRWRARVPQLAPYDVIVLTGSTPLVPQSLLDSLARRATVRVVGDAPAMAARIFTCVAPGAIRTMDLFETVVAPLANCAQPSRFTF